jgi:thiol-disulfide isomerase/thioredoxin
VQSDLAAAESDLATTESDLAKKESDVATAQSQISSLQSQKSSLQNQLSGAEAKATELEKLIAALEGSQVGNLVPDFKLTDLDGKTVSLRDLRGSPVMLNFWATWCGPCRSEMPYLQQIYEKWRDKGLILLTINLRETTSTVRQFMQEIKSSLPVLFDTNGDVGNKYSITAIPTTFFVTELGVIKERRVGSYPSVEAIESSLRQILPPPELTLFTPVIEGLKVTINGVTMPGTQGRTVSRIYWDWGDGSSEDHYFPASHTYKTGGLYTVKVTSYQSNGLTTVKSVVVQVSG